MRRAAGAPRSFSSFSFSFSDAAASPSPACALRSGRLALLPAVRGAGRCSPSVGPPLTWASSPTRAPATRAQGEDGSRDRPPEDPDAPRSLARPLPSTPEPSPARERDPACRSGGRVRACPAPAALCTGPACPLARKAGTGLPSQRLARKNGVL